MKTDYINQSEKCINLIDTILKLEDDLLEANPIESCEICLKIKTGLKILHKENSVYIKMINKELK